MPSAVASRYARALADLILKPPSAVDPREAVAQLRAFERALAGSPDLGNVLLSPAVPPPRKRAVVKQLAGLLGLAAVVRNFLYVVIDHRRIGMLAEIREAFESQADERLGLVRAKVSSAYELSEPQKAALAARLAGMTGKKVRCDFSVEEGLVGGAVARIGSTVYDGSVRGQLKALHERLLSE